jgi:hypothetical protein
MRYVDIPLSRLYLVVARTLSKELILRGILVSSRSLEMDYWKNELNSKIHKCTMLSSR